jgi:serine/threonine protein kinase
MTDANSGGKPLLSRNRIGEKLGAGRRGMVYPAVDISLKRPVAPKFVRGTSLSEEPTRARFLPEARIAAAPGHPDVCPIL